MNEKRRILLVELLSTDRLYQYRSELYPFLQGFTLELGLPLRWIVFGYRPDSDPSTRFVVRLPEENATRLLDVVRASAPTHILLNQALAPELARRLADAAGEAKISTNGVDEELSFTRRGDVARWLDVELRNWAPSSHALPVWDDYLIDSVEPNFSCELLGDLAREIRPFVQVLGGPICFYRAPLSQNPAFSGVALERGHRAVGCSFCGENSALRYPYRTAPAPLALRQVQAARTTSPPERFSDDFLLTGSAAFLQIRALMESVLAADIPPSRFFFYCRIDELRRKAPEIDALLPRLAAAGHSTNLFAMGVENFSPPENERFNKGITLSDVEQASDWIDRWEELFPKAFAFREHGGFSFILFTPWSTLDDLAFNVRQARRFHFSPNQIFFTSRLQLFEGRPITLLAERDSLLAPTFGDPAFAAYDSHCITVPGLEERPWRFLHPEVAAVYGVCIRLWPLDGLPEDDPLRERAATLLSRLRGNEEARFTLLDELIAAARAEAAPTSAALIERVESAGVESGLLSPPPSAQDREQAAQRRASRERRASQRRALRGHLLSVLHRLANAPTQALRGYTLGRVDERATSKGWGELGIELIHPDEEPLLLTLLPRAVVARPFRRGERFALNFSDRTPLDTTAKREAAAALLDEFERRISKLRAAKR